MVARDISCPSPIPLSQDSVSLIALITCVPRPLKPEISFSITDLDGLGTVSRDLIHLVDTSPIAKAVLIINIASLTRLVPRGSQLAMVREIC